MTTAATSSYLETLEQVITNVIAPAAFEIDRTGAFPRAALDALGQAGLLGLVSVLLVHTSENPIVVFPTLCPLSPYTLV